MSEKAKSVLSFLECCPARACKLRFDLVTVDANDDPLQSFRTLCDHNIMSAPVLDSNGKFIGFLEMCDLLEFLVFQMNARDAEQVRLFARHSPRLSPRTLPRMPGSPRQGAETGRLLPRQNREGSLASGPNLPFSVPPASAGHCTPSSPPQQPAPLQSPRRLNVGSQSSQSPAPRIGDHFHEPAAATNQPAQPQPTQPLSPPRSSAVHRATMPASPQFHRIPSPSPTRRPSHVHSRDGDGVSSALLGAQGGSDAFLQVALWGAATMFSRPTQGITNSYMARRHRNSKVNALASMLDICKLLAGGAHHVAVLDDDEHVLTVVSQSTIIQLINSLQDELHDELHVKLADCAGLVSKPVIFATENQSMIEVLRLMSRQNLASVPVISSDGEWVATACTSDLKVFVRGIPVSTLDLPVLSVLSMVHNAQDINARFPTISLSISEATLAKAIAKLSATRVHRLYITDAQNPHGIPVGVMSLTDLLRSLMKMPRAVISPSLPSESEHVSGSSTEGPTTSQTSQIL